MRAAPGHVPRRRDVAWTKHGSSRLESGHPFGVGDEELDDVAGHGHGIDVDRCQPRCVPAEPADTVGMGPATGDIKRCRGRVDADRVPAVSGEQTRERSRATADIEHDLSAQLIDQGDVHGEVGPIVVDGVVDPRKPRVLEDRISHEASLGQPGPRSRAAGATVPRSRAQAEGALAWPARSLPAAATTAGRGRSPSAASMGGVAIGARVIQRGTRARAPRSPRPLAARRPRSGWPG